MRDLLFHLFAVLIFTISVVESASEFDEAKSKRGEVKNYDSGIAYLLRLQWLPGECQALHDSCVESNVIDTNWTIHGLWTSEYCEREGYFKAELLGTEIREKLNEYWISIKKKVDNEQFWRDEFEKHGCVTDWNELPYFQKALEVYHQNNPGPKLTKAGITPGMSYSRDKFQSAFDNYVQLKCNEDNSINEMQLCFDKDYSPVDCYKERLHACRYDENIIFRKAQEKGRNYKILRNIRW